MFRRLGLKSVTSSKDILSYEKTFDPSTQTEMHLPNFETDGEPGLFESESLTFFLLEEISELTTPDFYERYKNLDNQNLCFEIQNPSYSD